MSHIALYRAWRPQTFQDMVGQQHVIQTLQNAIREDRVSHAYLFNGPRGTGKTSAAKIMAKAVNCEQGPTPQPCNECDACTGITAGSIMDVVEIDAASNRGIDEIRDIRDKVRYAPTEVRYKVYIIDEVHMLTSEAFNALLKTLEEPPGHVIFILATTEPHKLPATIISRCQRFDFRQVSLHEQTDRLKRICEEESIAADEDALAYIARLSDGGMRDAISLLEQVAAFAGERVTLEEAVDVTGGMVAEHFAELAEAIRDRDVAGIMSLIERLMQAGKSADKCMENLIYYFRDLLLLKLVPGSATGTERIVDPDRFKAMADAFPKERLFEMIDVLNRYQNDMRHAAQPQTLFEVALLKICTLPDNSSGDSALPQSATAGVVSAAGSSAEGTEVVRLRQRIESLEQQLEKLLKAGAGSLAAAANAAPAASGGSARSRNAGGSFGSRSGGGSQLGIAKVKLDPFVAAKGTDETRQILTKWAEMLQRVKDAKISVHAWLIDGEPVAVWDNQVLIAFKNTMHRETTERPANREIIEGVMQELFGRPIRFVTVMQKEWQAAEGAPAAAAEMLELGQEDAETNTEGKPPWVEEALQMFGEDLVVIVDNKNQQDGS
ncbi:DNA polymerase III subunit gamma/tau [Paenibacillus sambharensis]|uniref:DNA-directed DNA polymerase n=1 Tax=Paenibacillus sambharensis TaxID=1803190 RepID=A0A2W1L8I7_9BACL|nr:DNA polymerase III subunit gamma/tau [Paenibacillus sambharensis]PZD96488.1 DNA polymerase III subunit gamma/tau [Paenibacillus sambharensis]